MDVQIAKLSGKFYSFIPHKIASSTESTAKSLSISSVEAVEEKMDLLQVIHFIDLSRF